VAWLLFLGLLPMLTFFGHWPAMAVAIPGTSIVLQVPFSGPPPGAGHAHSHGPGGSQGSDTGDHEAHCHASMASCGDTRVAGGAPVTVLLETVSLLLGAGPWLAIAARAAAALRAADPRTFDPPPRGVLLLPAQ
jgi:hypothetical protein